jgi:beta-lactamase class A
MLLLGRTAAAASLHARIAGIADRLPGRIGVYARTLAPGSPLASYEATESFPTASTIKVLIMTTAYLAQQSDPGALHARIVFNSNELIGGSDFMSTVADGQAFTVAQLIVPMIQVSDNTAANMLMTHFGIPRINAVAARAGMTRTHLARHFMDFGAIAHHNDNISTAADMAHLLYLIEYGAHEGTATIVSPLHCRAMIKVMLGQTDRDGIPAAIPSGVAVANKTGELTGTRNDIAIVSPYGSNPFVLAIMTKDVHDNSAAYAAIHAVTRDVYASSL